MLILPTKITTSVVSALIRLSTLLRKKQNKAKKKVSLKKSHAYFIFIRSVLFFFRLHVTTLLCLLYVRLLLNVLYGVLITISPTKHLDPFFLLLVSACKGRFVRVMSLVLHQSVFYRWQ